MNDLKIIVMKQVEDEVKLAGWDRLKIYIAEEALLSLEKEARLHSDHEIIGLLIGVIDEGGEFIKINAIISAKSYKATPISVHIFPATWQEFLHEKKAKFPLEKIVGWYHTHPIGQVFLSNPDRQLHEGFFNEPWHLALVMDAQGDNKAYYGWDGDLIVRIDNKVHIEKIQI